MNILEINKEFNFDDLDLEAPTSLTGGSYFTKIINKNNFKSIYLQLPKCSTKQGIIKNNTKTYTDLMFNSSEILLLKWLEEFELFCQKKIFEKKDLWFHSDFTLNDIQEMMNPLTRLYKSGKFTILRCQIKNNKIKIYDENENNLEIDNLKNEDYIISLVNLNGIKFNSNNFTIDVNLVQLMIVNQDEELENCIINIKNKKDKQLITNVEESKEEQLKELKNDNNKNSLILIDDIEKNDIDNLSKNEELLENESFENNNLEEDKSLTTLEKTSENSNVKFEVNLDKNKDNSSESILDIGDNLQSNINNNLENEINLDNLEIDNENMNLKEVNLDEISEDKEKIDLKDAEMVYYEIYKAARKKAKQIKKNAIEAYLEAKKIKNQYMLEDIDDSSDSDMDELQVE
uniref:Uncharacterized protein n=1 Tax=Nucleocytoviricota sp. TaxID=2809609 RepID=A0A9E8JZ16_9VIRU|nr:hypothetical protein [Nucleocytoviricota sp.]UZT29259.1 hypothetical protein [Nucleocytoviricota sp.]